MTSVYRLVFIVLSKVFQFNSAGPFHFSKPLTPVNDVRLETSPKSVNKSVNLRLEKAKEFRHQIRIPWGEGEGNWEIEGQILPYLGKF